MLRRCCFRVFEQRLLGEAAAVAFYALLAVFPALAALISLCGLAINPATAAERLQGLASMLPAGSGQMVGQVLERTAAHGGRLGLGVGLAAAALWSATAASMQMFGALNLAYGEAESRRLLPLCGTALLFALGAMAFVALALGGVLAVPAALGAQAGQGGDTDQLLRFLRWPILLAVVSVALALTYRHGPNRACPRWRWVSWGGVVAAVTWLLGSAAVSWYVEHVSSFDWLYGSAGAVLGFMIWAWVSCIAVLIGAALNAEFEQQATLGMVVKPSC
jgi:membrane protein